MAETRIIACDNHCGQKMRAKQWTDTLEDGWLSVFDNHHSEDGLDFCSVQCLVDFYVGEE